MALPTALASILRSALGRTLATTHRLFHGYGRHDAQLGRRFYVPIHRTDAELRGLLQGGAR